MDDATKLWLENQKKICLCSGIRKATLLKILDEGVKSLDEFIKRSGACRGGCRGKRCYEELVKLYKNHKQESKYNL